jgi:acyl-CoA synthetase (AMP-forming)/AMP-acid ligase II
MVATLLDEASDNTAEIMDAEDPLFILYTSGSTGNLREWCILQQDMVCDSGAQKTTCHEVQ